MPRLLTRFSSRKATMNQAALEMLRSMFGEPGPIRDNPDVPGSFTRESLTSIAQQGSILAACILRGTEAKADTILEVTRITDFVSICMNHSHDEAGMGAGQQMDWPDVKREFLSHLKALVEVVETGDQVVKPVPRSAEAIKLFGLDKPKPEAEVAAAGFLSPAEMAEREANRFKLTPDQQVAENLSKHPAYADLAKPQLIHGTRDGWGTFNPDSDYDHLHRNRQPGVLDTKTGEFIPDGGEPTFGPTLGQTVAAG